MYSAVSITTVAFLLSIISLLPRSSLVAWISILLTLGFGGFDLRKMCAASDLNPSVIAAGSRRQMVSRALIMSSSGILVGATAKFNPLANNL